MDTWQVTLRKQLHHGSSRFDLDVHFRCTEARVVLYGPSGAGKTQTLAVAVYEAVQAGQDDTANLLVLIVSVTCVVVLLVAGRLAGPRSRP